MSKVGKEGKVSEVSKAYMGAEFRSAASPDESQSSDAQLSPDRSALPQAPSLPNPTIPATHALTDEGVSSPTGSVPLGDEGTRWSLTIDGKESIFLERGGELFRCDADGNPEYSLGRVVKRRPRGMVF